MNLLSLNYGLLDYLNDAFRRPRGPSAQLKKLLESLERKENDIRARLAKEKDPLERRHLKIEFKVTQMQREKGLARLRELQDR